VKCVLPTICSLTDCMYQFKNKNCNSIATLANNTVVHGHPTILWYRAIPITVCGSHVTHGKITIKWYTYPPKLLCNCYSVYIMCKFNLASYAIVYSRRYPVQLHPWWNQIIKRCVNLPSKPPAIRMSKSVSPYRR
jgi:hypothetical protein